MAFHIGKKCVARIHFVDFCPNRLELTMNSFILINTHTHFKGKRKELAKKIVTSFLTTPQSNECENEAAEVRTLRLLTV